MFGGVRGGRATGVQGVDGMVGLLIDTVPVRVPPHTDVPAINRLDAIGEQAAELPPHEHAGLAKVMRWSGLPQGAALSAVVCRAPARAGRGVGAQEPEHPAPAGAATLPVRGRRGAAADADGLRRLLGRAGLYSELYLLQARAYA